MWEVPPAVFLVGLIYRRMRRFSRCQRRPRPFRCPPNDSLQQHRQLRLPQCDLRLRNSKATLKHFGIPERLRTDRRKNNQVTKSHQLLRMRERDAWIATLANVSDICLRSLLRSHPALPGALPIQPTELQDQPLRRSCRVARCLLRPTYRGLAKFETSSDSSVTTQWLAPASTRPSCRNQIN